jgi:hypothetical protein
VVRLHSRFLRADPRTARVRLECPEFRGAAHREVQHVDLLTPERLADLDQWQVVVKHPNGDEAGFVAPATGQDQGLLAEGELWTGLGFRLVLVHYGLGKREKHRWCRQRPWDFNRPYCSLCHGAGDLTVVQLPEEPNLPRGAAFQPSSGDLLERYRSADSPPVGP